MPMLARLSRPVALLFAALFAAALVWSLSAPEQRLSRAKSGTYTDIMLYQDIVERMQGGESYYQAATAQQRQSGYPTQPFITVRLPTLYALAASFGWEALRMAAIALLLANALLWPMALPTPINLAERIGAGIAVAVGGLAVAAPALTAMSEAWCGLLLGLALALAIWRKGRWWMPLAVIAAALTLRELALPFVLLAALFALIEGKRTELSGWAMLTAAFAIGMAFHAQAVGQWVQPGDGMSPGWSGLQGPRGVLQALVGTSLLQQMARGPAMVLALLPALGWLALDGRAGRLTALCLGGYALMIALFSRPDNFYWGFLLLPVWFIGLVLVPRALAQLAGAITRR